MPFKKGDPNINRTGRKRVDPESKKPTNRELKEHELLSLLRKIKPHVSNAILQAASILKNDQARHQDQLKAAVIILENYRKLALDLYDAEEDEEGAEIQPQGENSTVFSLKVVNTD